MIVRRAFTLIELLVVLLLMALLTAGVTLSFGRSLHRERTADAIDAIRQFDSDSRGAAVNSGKPIRMVIDRDGKTVSRFESHSQLRARVSLPPGCRLSDAVVDGQPVMESEIAIDFSSKGWSRSYSIRVNDQQLIFSGLSGESTVKTNANDAQ